MTVIEHNQQTLVVLNTNNVGSVTETFKFECKSNHFKQI